MGLTLYLINIYLTLNVLGKFIITSANVYFSFFYVL